MSACRLEYRVRPSAEGSSSKGRLRGPLYRECGIEVKTNLGMSDRVLAGTPRLKSHGCESIAVRCFGRIALPNLALHVLAINESRAQLLAHFLSSGTIKRRWQSGIGLLSEKTFLTELPIGRMGKKRI